MQEGDNHHTPPSSVGRDFARFSFVGALGFAINLVLLYLLYSRLGWPIVLAQFIASEIALFHNFLWHHHWTYKRYNSPKSIGRLVIEFHATTWVAILGSVAVVTLLVRFLHWHYIVALVISSALAWFWNFGWTRYYVWRGPNSHPQHRTD